MRYKSKPRSRPAGGDPCKRNKCFSVLVPAPHVGHTEVIAEQKPKGVGGERDSPVSAKKRDRSVASNSFAGLHLLPM